MEQLDTAEAEEDTQERIATAGRDLASAAGLEALEREGGAMNSEDLEKEMTDAVNSAGIDSPDQAAKAALVKFDEDEVVMSHPHGDAVNVASMGESTIRVKRSHLLQVIREELMREK